MKVKPIMCHWNSHLQRSVTSTETSQLIYLFSPPRLCKSWGEAKQDAKSCVTRAAIHQLHSHSRRLRFRGVGHEMKTYGKSHLCCGDRTEEMRDCCRASVEGTKPWKKLLLFSPGYFSQQQGGREQRMFLSEEFFFLILGLFNLFTGVCGRCSLKLRLFCRNFSSICSFNCAFANSSLAFGYSLLGYLEKKGLNGSWREVPPAQITAN